ncbi:toxin-antitoxin system YwqK family antitoxin [Chitinophaga vietnamensis]|uniref:hypothetical protein n=1 Tax=Chitinophaga vietnamensis TaxID=2593957 RepID=UPI0011775D3E|nr:hypothetical protein [Chitinophaga vietnamensis]
MRTVIRLLTGTLLCTGCHQPQTEVAHEMWYNNTKAVIIDQASVEADSVAYTFNADSSRKIIQDYHQQHLLITRGFQQGNLQYEIYYSKQGDFEWRRELCENGQPAFEGIFYKNEGYGLTTWYNCDGNIREQGVRLKNEKAGAWKTWNDSARSLQQTRYTPGPSMDAFPKINKF